MKRFTFASAKNSNDDGKPALFWCWRRKNDYRERQCAETETGKLSNCFLLSNFAKNAQVKILSNRDRKTIEMGLFSGAVVTIVKNCPNDTSMIVATGESRYIISKKAAEKIRAH